MADGGRMKGVQSAGGGAGDDEEGNEEVREEPELALSLGRRVWHLPPRQEAAPRSLNWTPVLPEWNPDAAGSSQGVERALGGQSISSLGFHDMFGGILDDPQAGGSMEVGWGKLNEEDEDRDLQNKRLRVRHFGEENPLHSGASATPFGSESSFLPISDECVHLKLSRFPEHELEFGLSLFANDGSESPRDANNEQVDDAENSGGRNSVDVGIRMDLSDDFLHMIFSFLDQKDLCRAGVTCKQWRSASVHDDFWKCLKFENTSVSLENFVNICRHYQSVTELNLHGVINAETLVLEAIMFLRHLKTLTMGKGQLGESFFQALAECPLLTALTVNDASLGSGIQEVTVNHDGLRELHILKCRALRISVRCSQLQILSLRRTGMAHVSLNCPQLLELDFQSCHKLSDNAIRQAATACPLLAKLDMSSCSCVTDETLRDIASSCPSLSVLDASNCPNISFESVRLPMLIDLRLLSCEGITSASMAAIAYSRLLEALQLDNCSLLTSVSLDLPHLKNISLVHLRKFADLNLRSPVLSYIKVSRCSALHRVSITSTTLQKLVLQKQESLSSLSLQCHNLIDVDLTECESLTNAVCEVFSDGGGCPMLRSLILDNCENLSIVELNSSSLSCLSLAGCRSMTLLRLSCPNLQHVNLDGCDHLQSAAFCPVGLESLNLGICPKLSVLHIEAPNMSILELKGCGVLSKASINCPRLTSLDASFCRQLVDDSLTCMSEACPMIEHLILSSCLSIGIDGLSSLHCLHKLTLLDLSYTFLDNLKPVFNSCLQLKVLKLSACKYLSDSSLDALYREGALPLLVELDLSYSSIGQNAIEDLLACCTNLVNVNLNGCTNFQELVCGSDDSSCVDMPVDFCAPSSAIKSEEISERSGRLLEVLNCTGCPNIKKVVIPSIANFLHLSKINLNLSTNLKEVDLTCPNLLTLNLSNCSSLEVLKLDCPRLSNLQLLACIMLQEEELESAISLCSALEFLNVHSCPKINALDFGRLRLGCPSLKRIQSSLIS
ncbi:F-box/LRR-repeat protein 15 isoform X1 [Zea mays]|uniref:F-box/LRR-repeat protein 15 n=4 Tax=Zea mays TaxID=4577 RepID=A0A1D6KVY0_MAIZE|nr:F-box/LRR-repeat protein 15 isoform X1 [Zea mays]ONM06639.1 F-box/LRR-repeat protein 15 [Zea mays]ONM06646.1 F-box/LRR-repeat protein 15 [Zea mays]ONM06653.1 F-box/LRR-repeat protein 15 [Zea mays]ONM06654.1 F-box/LRR-repeat protein 15 [Zea mays]ONM06655.1 F-box/LRR-repeat protein 15 [Zea mays]|eukprot:XP_020402383.1 F-box/LRR-repeat protein 15 isoform X2 [Zea mays]